jgi:hypothetical protein
LARRTRDGVTKETGLLQEWPSNGGHINFGFQIKAGLGYSGFTIQDGSTFYNGSFSDKKKCYWPLMQIQVKKLWSSSRVGELLTNGWGDGPRMSPTVHGNKVYALGGKGNLVCVDIKQELIMAKKLSSVTSAVKFPDGVTQSPFSLTMER